MIERDEFSVRTTPRGLFGALIICACGHAIGAHTGRGCMGGRRASCACRLSDGAALAVAIGRASRPAAVRQRTAPAIVTFAKSDQKEDLKHVD